MLTRSRNVRSVTTPILAAIGATRAMLGAGVGLLASRRIPQARRRLLGWTLLGVGVATTVPLAVMVFRRR